MITSFAALLLIILSGQVSCENPVQPTSSTTDSPAAKSAQPVYIPPPQSPYAFFDGYGMYDAYYSQQQAKQQPSYHGQEPGSGSNYMSAIIPATQSALQFTLKALAKFGLFLLGGAALLLVGGVFTTILCSLTPICVISFPGVNGLSKESVRSLMNPDKISAAAAMVQDAIGKYQRLQRAVSD